MRILRYAGEILLIFCLLVRLGMFYGSTLMKIAAIIAAAGIGRRMGGTVPKQYLELRGRPIICHTLERFREARGIDEIVIVVEPGREEAFRVDILDRYGFPGSWRVVAGGRVRQESVANGLANVPADCDVVLVHDGVRPFISASEIERAAEVAARDGACIVASPVKETIKRVGADGFILETVDREELWSAQTPQGFRREIFSEALSSAMRDGFVGTDEASLVERAGSRVTIIEGSARNIKITTPADLSIAEAILNDGRLTTDD